MRDRGIGCAVAGPQSCLTPLVVRLPLDLLRSEMFLTGAGASDEYVQRCVDEILLPLLTAPRAPPE
ncbi:hypothetical protein [Rugosimonospora africana]|uniref:hypothetical protein n=1 Tax=Rugosimonospora africana TaxID=556532 RepID=UPI0019406EEB|nr:hypothetical protein [Rugosimonospora africana]